MTIKQRLKRKLRHLYVLFILHPVLKPYHYFIRTKIGWEYVNRHHRFTPIEHPLVRALNKDGYAIAHIDDFFPGRLADLEAYMKTLSRSPRKKVYLEALFEKKPVVEGNPFIAFALEKKILEIVYSYLGVCGKVRALTLDVTKPVGDAAPASSQRWHRDPEDRKTCKVFLYMTDVDEDSGPFMYVRNSHSDGKWKIFPQKPPIGSYPPQGAVERIVPKEDIKIFTGKKGTIIFCDTAGLHRGGYARSKERIMFTAGFMTYACAGRKGGYVKPLSYHALPD